MGVSWAQRRITTLFRVEEGQTWLEEALEWTAQDSIMHNSYVIPAHLAFTDGLALGITNHRNEATPLFGRVREIVQAATQHYQDTGTALASASRKSLHLYFFASTWLCTGERLIEPLVKSLEDFYEAERRSTTEGWELGEDGYEEMALLHILLRNGDAALEALSKASPQPIDMASVMVGKPTRVKSLALAAAYIQNPSLFSGDTVCARLEQGISRVMIQEFGKPSPDSPLILPWLDLPNVLFGLQGDPWAMLAQVNGMVGE